MSFCRRFVSLWLLVVLPSASFLSAAPPSTKPVEGLHQNTPTVHALANARLVIAPGRVLETATLVIRDGVIVAAGPSVSIPADARVWDLTGKSIYPGLIDAYSEMTVEAPSGGAGHWNSLVTPQISVADHYETDAETNDKLRRQGLVARLVAPATGILKGESALVTTSNEEGEKAILRSGVALHVRLGVPRGRGRDSYPNSPMGAVALARQTFLDADWYSKAWAAYQANESLPRPERNDSLAAMQKYRSGDQLVIIDGANELYFLRADAFAREFSLRAVVRGSGQEYQRLDAIRATGRSVILPVHFPRPPNVRGPQAASDVELDDLLHWDLAPENPAVLVRAGVEISLTGMGLKEPTEFLPAIRKAIERGLAADEALKALTVNPARLFGVADRLGTLEPGKSASFVVADGDLFKDKTKVLETWVDGVRFEVESKPATEARGKWDGRFESEAHGVSTFTLKLVGTATKPEGSIQFAKGEDNKDPVKLTKLILQDTELIAVFNAKSLGSEGTAQFAATLLAPRGEKPELAGRIRWANDSESRFTAVRVSEHVEDEPRPSEKPKPEEAGKPTEGQPKDPPEKKAETPAGQDEPKKQQSEPDKKEAPKSEVPKPDETKPDVPSNEPSATKIEQPDPTKPDKTEPAKNDEPIDKPGTKEPPKSEVPKEPQLKPLDPDEKTKEEKRAETKQDVQQKQDQEAQSKDKPDEAKPSLPSTFAANYPLGAFGRSKVPDQPAKVLFVNATVWTCAEPAVFAKGSVLIGGGKILAVGADIQKPDDAVVIDLAGKHLSPGIIDCHSHMGTDGGVNESTQAITAEVRVGDFIDCNDVNIYRQLAGGVTAANVLHGSANAIGGQNQVIKLRWGALPEEMKFLEAPPGIKFALGENPKQSNWGDDYTSRYPQSRMGVEQIIRDAFHAAGEYRREHERWQKAHDSLPPRRDLELEAVLEILDGKRWVHCHSYRQDEILALLRTCEEFNIRIATLQHILEGYKVADAMAQHGAMGSSFSDWWAYKFEVYDAIPYAGALMHRAGVVVSFNSDDAELARHLNHEAAKAMKYGNVPAEEALKFVTLNPAKQLRIDAYVGSIEPGKHADLVVWSGPPLSIRSRCEQTWIDGRKYFDLEEDKQQRQQSEKMRTVLVQKVLASGQTSRADEESKKPDEELWPREDIFCRRNMTRTAQ